MLGECGRASATATPELCAGSPRSPALRARTVRCRGGRSGADAPFVTHGTGRTGITRVWRQIVRRRGLLAEAGQRSARSTRPPANAGPGTGTGEGFAEPDGCAANRVRTPDSGNPVTGGFPRPASRPAPAPRERSRGEGTPGREPVARWLWRQAASTGAGRQARGTLPSQATMTWLGPPLSKRHAIC